MQIPLQYAACLLGSLWDVDDQSIKILHEYKLLGNNFFSSNFSPCLVTSFLFVSTWRVPDTGYSFGSLLNVIFPVILFQRLHVRLIWICQSVFFTSLHSIYLRPSLCAEVAREYYLKRCLEQHLGQYMPVSGGNRSWKRKVNTKNNSSWHLSSSP